jgi:hypothetical protein
LQVLFSFSSWSIFWFSEHLLFFHFSSTSEILFTSEVVPTRVPYFIKFVLISFIHAAALSKGNSVAFTLPDDLFRVSCRVTIWVLGFFCHNNFSDLLHGCTVLLWYQILYLSN